MPGWLDDAKRIDLAVYTAIAQTETPALDAAMRRLSRAADHSKLWAAAAAGLALAGGPDGRRGAIRGLASLGLASPSPTRSPSRSPCVAAPIERRSRSSKSATCRCRARPPFPPATPHPPSPSRPASATCGPRSRRPCAERRSWSAIRACIHSRVHTGVHYPGDVLIGAFIGVTAAELANRILDSGG